MLYTCIRCGTQFEAKHKTAVCANCHTAICVICGKEFKLQTPWTQVTCSPKCRGEYRKLSGIGKSAAKKSIETKVDKYGSANVVKELTKICKFCGKKFTTVNPAQMYCDGPHYTKCVICGKQIVLKDVNSIPLTCSLECRKKQTKLTCQRSYGASNVLISEHGKQKAKQTLMQLYGVDHYSKTIDYRDKFKRTSLERYGTEHPCQSEAIRSKITETNIERYGGISPTADPAILQKARETVCSKYGGFGFASEELADRIHATNVERYGSAYPSSTEPIKTKITSTNLIKYGTTNPASAGSPIRDKIEQTNLSRYGSISAFGSEEVRNRALDTFNVKYGVDNPFESDVIKEQIHQVILEKYGVDNPMQSKEIKDKAAQTCLIRYGSKHYGSSNLKIQNQVIDSTKLEEFLKFKEDPRNYLLEHDLVDSTESEIAAALGVTASTISFYAISYNCIDLIRSTKSNMEDDVVAEIRKIVPDTEIRRNCRDIISPFELDIYLPEYNVAIECNPTATHNSSISDPWGGCPKSYDYHKQKSSIAHSKGVFLFHIFGYEWRYRKDVVLSMIENVLGNTPNKYYGRNTYVDVLSNDECSKFLDRNHRQGKVFAKVRIGLRDKITDELLSVMTFNHVRMSMGKKSENNDEWELSRFCTKLHSYVVGGSSKLFKYFCTMYNPKTVVSFSDIAHTRGALYTKLGFTLISESSPSYVWVNYSDDSYLHRVQCQKRNLSKLFNEPDLDISNLTEREIMESHGYVRVYDSGVIRWEWNNSL